MSDSSRRDERTVCWCQHEYIYGAILPGARCLERLSAEASMEAMRRMKVIQWCQEHGERVRLTARHFGFSPDTIRRWVRCYNREGIGGLEPRSRRPRRVRQPRIPFEVVQRIQGLRERYPRWGREKLRVLLEWEGITLSAKSVDRVIGRPSRCVGCSGRLYSPTGCNQVAPECL